MGQGVDSLDIARGEPGIHCNLLWLAVGFFYRPRFPQIELEPQVQVFVISVLSSTGCPEAVARVELGCVQSCHTHSHYEMLIIAQNHGVHSLLHGFDDAGTLKTCAFSLQPLGVGDLRAGAGVLCRP